MKHQRIKKPCEIFKSVYQKAEFWESLESALEKIARLDYLLVEIFNDADITQGFLMMRLSKVGSETHLVIIHALSASKDSMLCINAYNVCDYYAKTFGCTHIRVHSDIDTLNKIIEREGNYKKQETVYIKKLGA